MSNALMALSDLECMAAAFAKSRMFGTKTADQIMALLLLAQAEGLHPAIAMRDFDVIQGRPAKKAEAMLRSFLTAGGKVEWHEMSDTKADATFSHEQGGTVRIDWDMARANKAGIGGKDMYSKYSRQMLANRVISEGCRRVCPASTSGLYVPEEVIHFQDEKNITPTAGAMSALSISRQELINETAAEVKAMLANDQTADAYALWQNSKFDTDEQVAFWSLFDSKQRGVLNRMEKAEHAQAKGVISESQKKRLEARIKEIGLDRDAIKHECSQRWGIQHFQELTKDQYAELDTILTQHSAEKMAQLPSASARPTPQTPLAQSSAKPATDATYITPEQALSLEAKCLENAIDIRRLKVAAKVERISMILVADYERANNWINAAIQKGKQNS